MSSNDLPSVKACVPVEAGARLLDEGPLELARRHAPYLARLIERHPHCVDAMRQGYSFAASAELDGLKHTVPYADDAAAMLALRLAKQRIALITGIADLSGAWDSATVSGTLSSFADLSVALATRHLLANLERQGRLLPGDGQAGCGYTVLAMGKHGAGELNYSSDIDLIVLADPDAPRIPDRDEAVLHFIRMTKRLVEFLQDRSDEGYVFRTDLRLRPDPGSMPIVVPVQTALTYYEARGQNWERAAMIKARPVAGDLALGDWFLEQLRPFVWRRYLDYAAIADIHSIKRQLQAHRDLLDLAIPGHNVKLGRGGIREIEFFVQTQQLIAGGRDASLRVPQTLGALAALCDAGWIEPGTRDVMSAAYATLRDVEHRLQMIDDQQTHTIPEDELARETVAAMCGFSRRKPFEDMLLANLKAVSAEYAGLFEPDAALSGPTGNLSFTDVEPDEGTQTTLSALGYTDPKAIITGVRAWHFGRYPAVQSAEARERLTELTPKLLECLAAGGNADAAFLAFDGFLKRLPVGYQLFHLLHANPRLLQLLARILASAPRLAAIIAKRPHVFDGLLEPDFFAANQSVESLIESLRSSLNLTASYEAMLDRARVFADEQRFGIGARILAGSLDPASAGVEYAELAEAVCMVVLDRVSEKFAVRHGRVTGGRCSVVAMGNLGTQELTASSDLDLVLLYEAPDGDPESDGDRPLPASQYFARLTQRFIAAMSAPTAEGVLYELDFRLRPSGKSGPIATSLASFLRYQREEAWTWEHMALTRARPVAGDPEFGAKVRNGIAEVLALPRDMTKIAADMKEMRETMDAARPAESVWDVKLARGGLIDLEFLTQFEALARGERFARTADGLNVTAMSLHIDNVTLSAAHSMFRSVLQLNRLCLDETLAVETAPTGLIELMLSQLQLPDVSSATAYLGELQNWVRQQFIDRLEKTP
ncbi:MAG: bifunctional [glutamine synthetase] adenylyltransferase/[glutamine synthetase]-adenylyl-L-tyrosine phosphorylase [Pseudomonadota bacterium]